MVLSAINSVMGGREELEVRLPSAMEQELTPTLGGIMSLADTD